MFVDTFNNNQISKYFEKLQLLENIKIITEKKQFPFYTKYLK